MINPHQGRRRSCINLPVRWWRASGKRVPRLSAELRQRESVRPLELFFDLVFVVGFTQCTALMSTELSWRGLARGLAVLAVLWWAWTGYAWLTSVVDPEEGSVRIAMFVAMASLGIVALCVPEAFDDRALAFALGVRRGARRPRCAVRTRQSRRSRSTTLGVGPRGQRDDRRESAHRCFVLRRNRDGCAVGSGDRGRLGRAGDSSAPRDGWTDGSSFRRTSPSATTW